MFSSITARRAAAVLAGGTLVASGLGLVAPAPAAQAAPSNPESVAAAAWLGDQLNANNVFEYLDYQGNLSVDIGTTLDFGLSLVETDADPATLAAVKSGIDAALASYVGASGNEGRVAKAAAFYEALGQDVSAPIGGVDLLDRLEGSVDEATGKLGSFGDTYAQAWAVKVLRANNSSKADVATEYLIDELRCDGAGWGYEFGGECVSAVDGTSYVLLALLPQQNDLDVAPAIDAAIGWLEDQQRADGGFGDWGMNTSGTTSEANGTGLAAWALGEAGETEPAQDAARWVADHQVGFLPSTCGATPLSTETGAIAYDDANIKDGLTDGIEAEDQLTWVLASAQSLAGLKYLSAAPASTPKVTAPTGFVRAGSTITARVTGIRGGQVVCVGGFGVRARLVGSDSAALTLPAATGNRVITLTHATGTTQTTVKALAAKVLRPVLARTSVARGGTQTVAVSGLAAGETVTVVYRNKVVRTGKATSKGAYRVSFPVGRVTGTKTVLVRGEFPTRRGSATFRVR